MNRQAYRFITIITAYRIIAAPVLILLAVSGELIPFKWLLAASFFTDLIDGYLARRFRVTSKFGSRLDSIGDDLTVLCGVIGMFAFNYAFIMDHLLMIISMLALFLVQLCFSLLRYRKISSFHTYGAKLAAILQGVFLITSFFTDPILPLFYAAALVTMAELAEEIVLVWLLPKWQANVKGLYWVLKKRKNQFAR